MTPDLAFGQRLVLLVAAMTGGFFGMGLGFMVVPSLLMLYPWMIPLWAAAGAAVVLVLVIAGRRLIGS